MIAPAFFLGLLVASALVGWINQTLWNYAAVGAFGAPTLAFGHAWALTVMIALNMVNGKK